MFPDARRSGGSIGLVDGGSIAAYVAKSPDGHWVVTKSRKSSMSPEAFRSLGTLVKEYVSAEIGKIEKRLAQIEQREVDLVEPLGTLLEHLEALEAREQRSLADAFQGPWMPQRTYRRGALVQHVGSACIALTTQRPSPMKAKAGGCW